MRWRKEYKVPAIIIAVILLVLIGLFFVNKFNKNKKPQKSLIPIKVETITDQVVENPLKRETTWGMTKQDVIKLEQSTYAEYLTDGKDYLTYNYVDLFDQEMLLTYLFKDDSLIGIVYENVLNELDKKNLTLSHQLIVSNVSNLLTKVAEENDEWLSIAHKIYDNALWSDSLIEGDIESHSKWYNGDQDAIYLDTTAHPIFDFLFAETDNYTFGNQALYLVDRAFLQTNELETLFKIKPSLTRNQTEIKEAADDLFENSFNEDAYNTGLAQNTSETIKIVRIDKVKEAILIINTTSEPISMNGYTLKTDNGNKYVFEDDFIIKANERIVVYGKDGKDQFSEGVSRLLEWPIDEIFDDKKDGVTLMDASNRELSVAK